MAYKLGDMVRIRDIRGRSDYPQFMTMLSGQVGRVITVRTIEYMTPKSDRRTYYELDLDDGKGLWPEDFLEQYVTPKAAQDEQEWIEAILKIIAEIEGKLDQLKRQLWRKKHYGK